MRRALAAAALVTALGAAIVAPAARTPPPARESAPVAAPRPAVMPDAAAIGSLRAVAESGAEQARTLRAAVRRCRGRAGAGRCVLLPLGNAAAGAKLSEVVLHALTARIVPGSCMTVATRLGGLVSTIAYLAVDGVRNVTAPGYTWAAALASVRVGRRIVALRQGRWPRHCVAIRAGPLA